MPLNKIILTTEHATYEVTRMCADPKPDVFCTWILTPTREPLHRDARSLRQCVEGVLIHAEAVQASLDKVVSLFPPGRA